MYYFKLIFTAVLAIVCWLQEEGCTTLKMTLDGKTLVWSDEFDDDGTTYMSELTILLMIQNGLIKPSCQMVGVGTMMSFNIIQTELIIPTYQMVH